MSEYMGNGPDFRFNSDSMSETDSGPNSTI